MNLDRLPYPSRRQPVFASNGAVATSQPLAAQAGLDVLRSGGNAVDAALAAAVTLTVVEPTSNGIGGDLFAIVWDGSKLHGLNSSGRAPRALDAGRLRALGHATMPELGWLPVTVPGVPAGWEALHGRFGRVERARVYRPAVEYARDGFAVSPVVADSWARYHEKIRGPAGEEGEGDLAPQLAGWLDTFTRGGRTPATGERWRLPDHARTLETLAREGAAAFHTGSIAAALAGFARRTGGPLTLDDLAAHRADWVEPIGAPYRGYEVWELPPNGQGIAALMGLSILEGFDLARHPHVSVENWHLEMEAMKLAFADAHRYVADPDHVAVPVAEMLRPEYAEARRALVGDRAMAREPGDPGSGGTVYLCTADRDGMMVSLIQSNYHGFGSGIVVPGTGIALHNRGLGFTLEEGHPNEYAPGKRPFHTIIPAFLTRSGRPVGPFGVMGAPMQPQGHMQVVIGTLDHGLNPQAVLDAPRWRVLDGLDAVIEPGAGREIFRGLEGRGHRLIPPDPAETYQFGRGQIIWRLEDGVYAAGSDPRADGQVAAW